MKDFTAYAVQTFTDDEHELIEMGRPVYKHVIQDKTLTIKKDGVSMTLDQEEILQILTALQIATHDFKKGLW